MGNGKGIGYDPRIRLVAVTGGPCGGKSTILATSKRWLEERGLRVIVVPEAATELISAGLAPWEAWRTETAFQEAVLRLGLLKEDLYYSMARELATDKDIVMLCDRGARDGEAYVGRDAFLGVCERVGVEPHRLLERYAAVVHLVTAAEGAERFYTLANNAARTETAAEALALDRKTRDAWKMHPHFCLVDNSTGFEEKKLRALQSLSRVLRMPKPLEKERKFKVIDFAPDMIPEGSVAIDIAQDYLTDSGATERRVRERFLDGGSSYYYTEKAETGELGVREETERLITLREYEALLRERDPKSSTIRKTRYCFESHGRHFELDVYAEPVPGFVVLEVELKDMSEDIVLPSGWNVVEVTGDKRYSNRSIARGSLKE